MAPPSSQDEALSRYSASGDQEVEITPDHMKQTIQSQNYVNQWGLPYQPIETRPWNDMEAGLSEITEEDLQAQNPMGTDDYTPY